MTDRDSLWSEGSRAARRVLFVAVFLVGCGDTQSVDLADADVTGSDVSSADATDVTDEVDRSDVLDDVPFEFAEAAPEAVGMDADILERAREYAFAPGRNTQAVLVVRHGTIVAEWYAEDRDARSLAASWSVGKSFAGALIGIALERGEIPSIDEPMTTYIPEWEGTDKAEITLRDVLEMASGLHWNEDYSPSQTTDSDVAQMVLDTAGSQAAIVIDNPLEHTPGTTFHYSSGDAMLLSRVMFGATGQAAGEYAQRYLFEPLGIEDARWWRDRSGDTLTYCCVDMPTRSFARFGQAFLEGGSLGGRQVIPEAWVAQSTSPSRSWEGYGFQWWRTGVTEDVLPEDAFSALGHDGQYIHVVPSLDLVVVRNGMYWPHDGEAVADPSLFAVYPSEGLFPGHGTAPPDSWSDDAFLGPILESIVD